MPFDRTDPSLARIAAHFHTGRLSLHALQRERQELAALRGAGQDLAADPVAAADERLQPLFAALARHRTRLDRLSAALAASLEADRADYASVAPWMRPLVVLRGLSGRAVLHHQLHQCRRDLGVCHEALGRAAGVPTSAVAARAVRNKAPVERTERPRPVDGEPQPRWLGVLVHEGRALGTAVWQQLHSRLAPRVSALAGLAAGWWVASTYTDSHLRSIMSSVGIGGGGTHVVSGTTYRAMSFWLPILAAATCAYLGDRLARVIRHRYEAGTTDA